MKSLFFLLCGTFTISVSCTYAQYAGDADAVKHARHASNTLFVKFKNDLNIHLVNGKPVDADGKPVKLPLAIADGGTWKKASLLAPEKLEELRTNAERNLGRKLPDPNASFYYYANNSSTLDDFKNIIGSIPLVDYVLYMPIPTNAVTDYQSFQAYLPMSNSGINAEAVWSTYNNRGHGIKVCDIEYDYTRTHFDYGPVTILGFDPIDPFSGGGTDHGTAVLGEIASLNNGEGTTGIAADCDVYFAGTYDGVTYDISVAITNAMSTLTPGDVIIIEQQIDGPNYTGAGGSQFGLVPVEWYEPFYDAIVLATGNNITVVEAGGNGEQDLDGADYQTGNGGHWPFMGTIHSGAIIVGAGSVDPAFGGTDVPRSKQWYSNYGTRIDIQGNGEAIFTTGYGDLYSSEGPDKYYTSDFGGTSGASPIVTGAVILLQSVYHDSTGQFLPPYMIRDILVGTGQPQQAGTYPLSDHIGPLPDVFAAIQSTLATVGINETTNTVHVNVYPNPTTGFFVINSDKPGLLALTITNNMGEIVWQKSNPPTTVSVDLTGLATGIYYLHSSGQNGVLSQKLVISK